MMDEDINISTSRLVEAYSNDLSDDFPTEFRQFISWYIEQKSAKTKGEGSGQYMFQLLHTTGVHQAFLKNEVALRIYLCLMATNCLGTRSFFQLKRIKDVKRSTLGQQRLGALALLRPESGLLRRIDF